jgi:hypothetical protein
LCWFTCDVWHNYANWTNTCNERTLEITSAYYNQKIYSFTWFILSYWTPQEKTSKPLTITWWTLTLTAKFTLQENGTWYILSNQEETLTCNTNYTVDNTNKKCDANTQTFTCTAKPATWTVWNIVSSYEQTWNGSTWTPSDSTTNYNTTESTTSCNYKCDTNYTRHNDACNQNCNTTTNNWYTVPATNWWVTTSTLTKTWSITWWTQTKETTYTCNNGTFTQNTETISDVTCWAWYYSTDNQTCVDVWTWYYSPADSNTRIACPTNSTTNWLTTASEILQCLWNAGYRNCEDETCDVVGIWYYSLTNSNTRTQCQENSSTSTTTSSSQSDCLCDDWYYASATNVCSAVWSWYSSPALDNARYSWNDPSWWECTNLTCTSRSSPSTCSATCWWWTQTISCTWWSGTQKRTVQCIRSTDNVEVGDSYCTTAKPETSQSCSGNPWGTESQDCNTQGCEASLGRCNNNVRFTHYGYCDYPNTITFCQSLCTGEGYKYYSLQVVDTPELLPGCGCFCCN